VKRRRSKSLTKKGRKQSKTQGKRLVTHVLRAPTTHTPYPAGAPTYLLSKAVELGFVQYPVPIGVKAAQHLLHGLPGWRPRHARYVLLELEMQVAHGDHQCHLVDDAIDGNLPKDGRDCLVESRRVRKPAAGRRNTKGREAGERETHGGIHVGGPWRGCGHLGLG